MTYTTSKITHEPVRPISLGSNHPVVLNGRDLTIDEVVRVAQKGAEVKLTTDAGVLKGVEASHAYIVEAAGKGKPIYGVTTGFGGMAHTLIAPQEAGALQENLIWFMKSEAGERIPTADVRAAMLIRANTHLLGYSGLRLELIRRMITFLNAKATPHVREFGSIGASGDLTPLASITGALIGLDPAFRVDLEGQDLDCLTVLKRLKLPPLQLLPKEGLAMINGTAVMSGIAANCLHQGRILLALAIAVHALAIQALEGSNQPFHPFIHSHKPHPGQKWAAVRLAELLKGSQLIRDEWEGRQDHKEGRLVQDRYSMRCLPQYMGPAVDIIYNAAMD